MEKRQMRPLLLVFLVIGFAAICATILGVVFTQTSPAFRYDLVRPSERAPTSAPPTGPPTTAPPPTSASVPPTTASPTGAPTTGAPTFAALAMTCPADLTVTLGSSLELTYTGGSPVVTGGCSTPVLQYQDVIAGAGIPSIARSPSQPLANLFLWATQQAPGGPGPVQGAQVSVSPTHLVWTTQWEGLGAQASVVDRLLPGTVLSSFFLNTLPNVNASCSVPAADAQATVLWDAEANRWIAAQWANSTIDGGSLLCLYLSWTSNPAGPYEGFSSWFPQQSARFQLGVWGRTYAITRSQEAMPMAMRPLCVVDREAFLTFNATLDPNATEPGVFCDAPLNAVAHPGWGGWSPVHADSERPGADSAESAGAGTAGAVFLRPIDDEYQLGSMMTPNTDYIEVEHWYNLNWTTQTHGTVRYRLSVADFSQQPGTLCGDTCVPTPTGTRLNAQMGSLMPRPTYRRIAATGQESVVLVWTSHSNDVNVTRFYWAELRWQTPTTQQQEPVWIPYQQGVSPVDDGIHRFLPSACMDANGTVAIGYSVSSNTSVYPGLWATSRLGNDALGTLRQSIMLHEGALGSIISPADPAWGPAWNMACDPGVGRWFYFSGAVSDLATVRVTHLDRLRVLGEIVERHWRADDYCGNQVNCTQYITTI